MESEIGFSVVLRPMAVMILIAVIVLAIAQLVYVACCLMMNPHTVTLAWNEVEQRLRATYDAGCRLLARFDACGQSASAYDLRSALADVYSAVGGPLERRLSAQRRLDDAVGALPDVSDVVLTELRQAYAAARDQLAGQVRTYNMYVLRRDRLVRSVIPPLRRRLGIPRYTEVRF